MEALWPILLAANAVPVLVQFLTLPFFPDSPRYLLIDRKDKEGCIKGKEMGQNNSFQEKGGNPVKHQMSLEESYRWEQDSWCFGTESIFSLKESQPLLFGY